MEIDSITYTTIEGSLESSIISNLTELYTYIFSDADAEFCKQRISEHSKLVTILAFHGKQLIAFKNGYPFNKTIFYSRIGGVKSNYRNKGVASKLAELQEANAKIKGFHKLRTKSMNTYKPMMILNLKNGFDFVKFYTNTNGQTKIVFEKVIY